MEGPADRSQGRSRYWCCRRGGNAHRGLLHLLHQAATTRPEGARVERLPVGDRADGDEQLPVALASERVAAQGVPTGWMSCTCAYTYALVMDSPPLVAGIIRMTFLLGASAVRLGFYIAIFGHIFHIFHICHLFRSGYHVRQVLLYISFTRIQSQSPSVGHGAISIQMTGGQSMRKYLRVELHRCIVMSVESSRCIVGVSVGCHPRPATDYIWRQTRLITHGCWAFLLCGTRACGGVMRGPSVVT